LSENAELILTNKDCLIVADVQNDFLPGGALGIHDGDQIVPVLNEYIRTFKAAQAPIVASRDWHPPKHISFHAQGGLWPAHCIKDTPGAQFSPDLKLPANTLIISKATDSSKEAYSVFDDTDLGEQLRALGVSRVFIGGVATDYCVVNSVVDACKLGFDVVVLVDAVRGIELHPGDVEQAFVTMSKLGADLAALDDFPEPLPLPQVTTPPEPRGEKSLIRSVIKKQARMRSRGSYGQVRRERA
jgi:nicotinamidase/pyrazinamidase